MTTPDTTPDHLLYLRWLARRQEREAQRTTEERARTDRLTHDMAAKVSVMVGNAANDGTGRCRWCRLQLGTDGKGNRTHPDVRECSGPAPEACSICGAAWQWDRTACRWGHACRGRRIAAPRTQQVERVQTPGDGTGGVFGYRRGDE